MIRKNIQLFTYLFIFNDSSNPDLIYCGFLYGAVRMIKSKRMRWAGNVARMEATRNTCRAQVGKSEKNTIRKTWT
jgi:hypothetical protein